ncbi:MAG: alpha/beta fold hydrolase [Ruminococcaceae bacterium]|nr:alpha/beta fold hydrolase [Oscillospiraceae bacterium]
MTERRFIITGDYGIVCREFLPDDERVTGVILGVHGFAGDKESSVLRLLAEELSKSGTALVCFDFPAHGESPAAEEGLTVKNCKKDLLAAAEYIRERYPNAKKSIFATSFGGYVSLLCRRELSDFAFVLRAPAVTMPTVLLDTVLKISAEDFRSAGYVDCGFERKISLPYGFFEELCCQEDLLLEDFHLPMLIIHGDRDGVVPLFHILEFSARHPEARLEVIEGADHRFKNPGETEKIVALTRNYLSSLT